MFNGWYQLLCDIIQGNLLVGKSYQQQENSEGNGNGVSCTKCGKAHNKQEMLRVDLVVHLLGRFTCKHSSEGNIESGSYKNRNFLCAELF